MHPELFRISIGGYDRPINSYGTLIVLGVTAAVLTGVLRARRYGLLRYDVFAVGMLGFCGGIAGAVGLYVLVHLPEFVANPALLQSPGMVFYGGFAGGALAAWLYCRRFGVSLARVAEAGAPGLALGHAFGRVGCYLGGCCFGRDGHPVQLYEAVGLLVLAAVTALLPRRAFAAYLGGYALLRLGTEHFRGDDHERGFLLPGMLSTSQAIAIVALACALFLVIRKENAAHGR